MFVSLIKHLRLLPVVILSSIVGARSASAAPITFTYEGYVTSLAGSGIAEFFPDLAEHTYFSGSFTFPGDDTTPQIVQHDLVFGAYEAGGFGGNLSFPGTTDPLALGTTSQHMLTAGPIAVNVQWIQLSLDAGWQTGHVQFLAEGQKDFFKNALWEGTITDVQAVPEPATLALSMIGLGVCAMRRRRKH